MENLTEHSACILISNHASILDIPGIVAASPLPVRFIAKRSLAWFPVFGWFMHMAGHVLIERESSLSAMKSLNKASLLMKKGISIVVFPEGTRSPDGEVKEFKRGGFVLALQDRVPIVPISISGTYQMLPRKGWCFWPGTIDMKFCRPIIPPRSRSTREAHRLTEEVRRIIINNKKSRICAG